MKILYLGDPHCRIGNLEESDRLLDFVNDVAIKESVDRIVILGDCFHNHAVVRVEVLVFWKEWLDTLSEAQPLFVLVGNHDRSGDHNSIEHALDTLKLLRKPNLHIVDLPIVDGCFGYLPHLYDVDKFVESSNLLVSLGAKTIVCHNTPNGSKFKNGMFAPDGFDPDLIKADPIICGHIHNQQRFGKIIIPGTARWMDDNDLNQKKGIWIFEHDDVTGGVLKETFIDTSSVCQPLLGLLWREGEAEPEIPPNSRTTIELIGSSTWVSRQKAKIKGRCGIKTRITDRPRAEGRRAGGGLAKFVLDNFEPTKGITKVDLLKYMKEKGLVGTN
jgi:predicted phosphodiesterase